MMPPSTSIISPSLTGCNSPGIEQLACTATPRGPDLSRTSRPTRMSVVTAVNGSLRSSKVRHPVISSMNRWIRSPLKTPIRPGENRTRSPQSISSAACRNSQSRIPEAMAAPTIAPPEVPATAAIGIRASISTRATPTPATEYRTPPPRASPTPARTTGSWIPPFASTTRGTPRPARR